MIKLPAKVVLWFLLILNIILFHSCNEPEPLEINQPGNFSEVYELFWKSMYTNYVYWDIDSTNWKQKYYEYKPVFEGLDLNEPVDVKASVGYFRKMTEGLMDGHFKINFTHQIIDDLFIDPLSERKKKRGELHDFYTYLPHDTIYLDPGFKFGIDYTHSLGTNQPLLCLSGKINNSIIYFSCNYFGLVKSYLTNPNGRVNETLNYFFKLIQNKPVNAKGVIIDVRGNPGGDLADLNFLMGRFIDKPLHIGYAQYKRNSGEKNFTPWINTYIEPYPGAREIDLPIIVLADNYSASLSETVVMAIRSMPKSSFLGENTWGATGPIIPNEVYKSGSFEIKDFMKVRTSACKFKYLDNVIYEGKGLKPDIYVPYSFDSYTKGIDIQLEKAIELLD